jgi:hypothetical protein
VSLYQRARNVFRRRNAGERCVHIYRPATTGKSLTSGKCIDCKADTIFVGFHQEWHGWTETCVRCGRRFADGEWLPLDFSREARRANIKSVLEQWGRATDAERIHRVKVKDRTDA